ncbi:ComEC/Rec2 family competence protein [Haloimpatiens sp. FM7315]|uniref:ComEC/Rec2 family competence protein n=1 Tax=Haloimpatiens sp. FM7315 TaxID=3298609 RepID=UPI00370C4860
MYNRPLVYYLFFIVLGGIGFIISTTSYFLCITLFLVILIPFFFTLEDKRFFVINIMFLLMGLLFFNLYFNIRINGNITVRVKEKDCYSYVGSFKGRKILLKGKVKNLKEGMKVSLKGNYKSGSIYEKGIIGSYYVNDYKANERDFICKIYEFKESAYEKYSKILGKEKASVVLALCCGEDKYISYENKKEYSRIGIVHVLSVSGFHICIVYKVIELIFGKMSPLIALVYVIFTGNKASAIRAYIMIVILKLSKGMYKSYDAISALCLAGMVLLALKPYYILDIGFNLSFLSTLGILLYYKKINRCLYRLPKMLNEGISMCFSAQVFSMPYMAFTLKDVSISFLLGNVFLMPMYSITIILGNVTLVSIFIDKLFRVFCYILYPILLAIEGGSRILLALSLPNVKLNTFYGLSLTGFYIHYILLKSIISTRDSY